VVVPWPSGFLLLLPAALDNLARDLDVAADLLDRVRAAAGQVGPGARVHLAISSPVRSARELGHGLHEAGTGATSSTTPSGRSSVTTPSAGPSWLLGGDPARGDLRLTVELALKLSDLPRLSG
jgi:hypothetical protein